MSTTRTMVLVVLLAITHLDHGTNHSTPSTITLKKSPIVRVLLDTLTTPAKGAQPRAWSFECEYGFVLYDPDKPINRWQYKEKNLEITYKHHAIYINEKKCIYPQLRIIPKNGYAIIDGKQFHGTFHVTPHNGQLALINHVDLEEYVCAVLKTESWPGWPVEVNKVFAIMSRSYVLAMIKQAKDRHAPYHVKNTNDHQTYQGMHECKTIKKAVEQTRGLVLLYDNQPALAMFDSCCGGVIPAHIEDFDFEKAPYLARPYACEHCKRCRIYTWHAEIPAAEFHQKVSHLFHIGDRIQKVQVAKQDRAGLVKELTLHGSLHKESASGKQMYGAFKEIKSFCFTIEKEENTFVLQGKGFGHHIGLCQWGAREMVRDHWNYKQILSFYYPGTTIRKLI